MQIQVKALQRVVRLASGAQRLRLAPVGADGPLGIEAIDAHAMLRAIVPGRGNSLCSTAVAAMSLAGVVDRLAEAGGGGDVSVVSADGDVRVGLTGGEGTTITGAPTGDWPTRANQFAESGGFCQQDGVYLLDCEEGGFTLFGRRGGVWEGSRPSDMRQTIGTCDSPAPPRDRTRLRAWLRRQLRDR